MCGIAGVVRGGPAAERERLVGRMCTRMSHRGPDDRVVVSHTATTTFGFVRLAIIDVAGGGQPLPSCDGAVTVIDNGEIYNHVELRAALTGRGHRFRTGSDCEVVAHLYEESGLACLEQLNGMFALAIDDARSGEVHLARDRVGVKPLYWAAGEHGLVFASELSALLEDRSIARSLDREAVAELLTLTYVPAPRTPVRGVSKLPAGTALTWREGVQTVRSWWTWPIPGGAGDGAGVQARVRELLVDAVRLQLRSDVPLGVLLSGGVDSTAILWAVRELGETVQGYCVDFGERGGDAEYADLAGRRLGAEVQRLALSAHDAEDAVPLAAARLDDPLGDPAVLPSLLVCRAAAARVRVLLSGTGADELWGGYGRYTLAGTDAGTTYVRELSVLPEREVRAALGLTGDREPVRDLLVRTLARADGGPDPAGARMYLDGVLSLPGDLLPLLDQTSMAVSIEARVPLLDHRLVELAAGLPGPQRIPGGSLKGLFRGALRGCIPDEILDRPKRGFNPPLGEWARGPWWNAARQVLDGPGGLLEDVLDAGWVARWLRQGAAPMGLLALRQWSLVVFDLWYRRFRDASATTPPPVTELVDGVA